MKSSIKIILALNFILTGFASMAQVMSLDSVLILIDKQNPMLQENENRIKAQRAYVAGAKSWMAMEHLVFPFLRCVTVTG